MWQKLRYEIWPVIKVYTLFTWWRIRYGGAKNIPPELLRERTERSIENMREQLHEALRALPDDATDEERQQLLDAIKENEEIAEMYREQFDDRDEFDRARDEAEAEREEEGKDSNG